MSLLPDEVEGCLTSHYTAELELMPRPTPGRDRLLELGAGHCEIARVLRRQGWHVHTADLQQYCVAEAIALGFPATRLDLNEGVPFPDGALDLVVMLEVIEHVVRTGRALGEIWRVLSPGGHLLFSTPNHAFYKSRIRALKGRPLGMEGGTLPVFCEGPVGVRARDHGVSDAGSQLVWPCTPPGWPMGAEAPAAKAGPLPNSRVVGVDLCYQFRLVGGPAGVRR